MSQYDDTNRGALFKNDKGDNPNRPDYKGKVNVDGKEYYVSSWIKEAGPNAKNPGAKFLSLSLEAVDQVASAGFDRAQSVLSENPAQANNNVDLSDVPF